MEKRTKNTLAIVCIALVCAIAVPAIIADFASDDFITINTITRTTTLGDNASYQITIENIGDETDTFSLTAINTDNASITVLSQTEMVLDPGQSENVGSLVIPVKSISMINQVNKEYPFKSRCMR